MPRRIESSARCVGRKGFTADRGIALGSTASHDRTASTAATFHNATSMHSDPRPLQPSHWGIEAAPRDCEHWHTNRNRKSRANSPADSMYGALTVVHRAA